MIEIYGMGRVPPEREWFAIEMEYFPSESLAQKLENRSHNFGNTYQRLFAIYRQVLDAVQHLASLEIPISHGDIKPHNILIGQGDLVKLTDFGSSALPEEIYVRTRENGGTVLYSAPEYSDCVSRKGTFDELMSGDIYSLGVLLYQLMTGSLPHDTQSQVRSHTPFSKPTEINSGICHELEQVILRCLQKYPKDRFQSIDELVVAFDNASSVQLTRKQQYALANTQAEPADDWSSQVVAELEKGNYQNAAKLAESEYQRSCDEGALLQQLNALYRQDKFTEFVSVLLASDQVQHNDTENASVIRQLAIRVYLKTRNLDKAQALLDCALEVDGPGYELGLLDASLSGLLANYSNARGKLEQLNRVKPGQPYLLRRLIQACEQMRDYESAASYLRALQRVIHDDQALTDKRQQYIALGVW